MMRLWSQFLLTIPLIVAANRADAAVITVTFSGTFSGSHTGNFRGSFDYDESQPDQAVHGGSKFDFSGSPLSHAMQCTDPSNPSTTPKGSGVECEPFSITISKNSFTLVATLPQSPSTTVTIWVPMSGLELGKLPKCSAFPPKAPYGTLTLSGESTPPFTRWGTITAISCELVLFVLPSPPSPPPCPPPSPPPCYVYTYPAPAPCPAYACPPRPACCLTRLFARRVHRNSCW